MEKTKTFDAVKMMKEIREKLSEKSQKHLEISKEKMEAIGLKYNLKIPKGELNLSEG